MSRGSAGVILVCSIVLSAVVFAESVQAGGREVQQGRSHVEVSEVEADLRDSIEGLRLRRNRIEERLATLEADAEAGLLKRPPATAGREDEGKTQGRDDVQDDRHDRGEGRVGLHEQRRDGQDREEEEKEAETKARELEIARDDIVARPVEPIPYEQYVRLYRESAERYGFARDWYVLAAVGKIESDHGENTGTSGAGAMGPMQFLPSTWSSYGVDGDGDGTANIMDPEDAIPAAASYLEAGGAPEDWYAALFTYNRAAWYVEEVLAIAESYRQIHGDDAVGPYLENAPSPKNQTAPTPEFAPPPEEAPKEGEEPQQKRPVEDVPSEKETEPEARPDTGEESTSVPNTPPAADESTTEQYQY